MDMTAIQAWFRALSQSEKVLVLVGIMWEFTLIMRDIALRYPDDCATRWRLAYHLSEMNHRFASAASAMMKDKPTFPGDVLMEILLDQSSYPEIEVQCQYALDRVMRLHGIQQT